MPALGAAVHASALEAAASPGLETLGRLRRQAPAEASLIDIQIQRMTCNELEFTSLNAHGAYAIAAAGLQSDALNQIARQGRRLLSLYQQLRQEILTNRQLFPPSAPEPPNQHDLKSQETPVETKLPEDQQPPIQTMENESVEIKPVETKLVETKLTASAAAHLPLPRETRVHNPPSPLHAALPPIAQPAEHPAPTTGVPKAKSQAATF